MTLPVQDPPVSLAFPDILALSLDEIAALAPLTLEKVVGRVLPERPVKTISLGTAFASSI